MGGTMNLNDINKATEQGELPIHEENQFIEYVKNMLSRRTLLEQLAEEASELAEASAKLAQVSLKLIRAEGLNHNPTPLDDCDVLQSIFETVNNMHDEYRDVELSMCALELIAPSEDVIDNPKWVRWAERLGRGTLV